MQLREMELRLAERDGYYLPMVSTKSSTLAMCLERFATRNEKGRSRCAETALIGRKVEFPVWLRQNPIPIENPRP